MTTKEAIERLVEMLPIDLFGSMSINIRCDGREVQALRLAIAALREKADKERRYVVEPYGSYWAVYEMPKRICLACYIPTREAAQAIADIYEGVKL